MSEYILILYDIKGEPSVRDGNLPCFYRDPGDLCCERKRPIKGFAEMGTLVFYGWAEILL